MTALIWLLWSAGVFVIGVGGIIAVVFAMVAFTEWMDRLTWQ